MIGHVLAGGAVGEAQRRIQCVFGIDGEPLRHLPLPAPVDAGGVDRAAAGRPRRVGAFRLVQPRLRVHLRNRPAQVLHHVGVVHAGIHQQPALLLAVPPHRDEHHVGAAETVVQVKARRADGAGLDQRARQPVQRIAAIVLRHAHHQPRAVGALPDVAARRHRHAQRLLHHHVPALLQRARHHGVVPDRTGGDVHRLHAQRRQLLQARHGPRTHPEVTLCRGRQRVGIGGHRIARADQPERTQPGAVQLCKPLQVAVSHTATTDDGQRNLLHPILPAAWYRLAPMAAVRYVLAMNQIPIVDTHQHLWDIDLLNLPWLDEAPQLARHHRIDDYLREVAGHGVARAVYMEVDVAPG